MDDDEDGEDDEGGNLMGDCRGRNGLVNNVGRIHAGLLKVEPVISLAGLSSLSLGR